MHFTIRRRDLLPLLAGLPLTAAAALRGSGGSGIPAPGLLARRCAALLLEGPPPAAGTAAKELAALRSDGSWPDVDYASQARTLWPPALHLRRLGTLARLYAHPESARFRDPALLAALTRGIAYWERRCPVSVNWWFQQIDSPRRLGEALLLIRSAGGRLPQELLRQTLERWDREGGDAALRTGANRTDIAAHRCILAMLRDDADALRHEASLLFSSILPTEAEGLQADGSFHQHGAQLYIGGYGEVWMRQYAFWLTCFRGTGLIPAGGTEAVVRFATETFLPSYRGGRLPYNLLGRHVGSNPRRPTGPSPANALLLRRLAALAPARAALCRALSRYLSAEHPLPHPTPRTDCYWRSAYFRHIRPDFTFDRRCFSDTVSRCEWGNGENLLGHWLAEGATGFLRTGAEYADIAPIWDWHRIPGTTVVDRRTDAAIPRGRAWQDYGTGRIAGGVASRSAGLAVYCRTAPHEAAKTAVFAFGDAVVCLGTDLCGDDPDFSLITTVNQCFRDGPVTPAVLSSGDSLPTPATVTHGGFRYTFPGRGRIRCRCDRRQGSWHRVAEARSDPAEGELFTLWIDHGKAPHGASYAYVVSPLSVPDPTPELTLRNAPDLQAVADRDGHVGIVFHRAGASVTLGGRTYAAEQPCVLLNDRGSLLAADPTQRLKHLTVSVGDRLLTAALPQGALAGSPVTLR